MAKKETKNTKKIEAIAEIVLDSLKHHDKFKDDPPLCAALKNLIRNIAFNPLHWGEERGVSEAAQKMANDDKDFSRFNYDLRYIKSTQLNKLKDPKRPHNVKAALALDHYMPVKILMQELFDLKNPDLKAVIKVMRKSGVNVITWQEHEARTSFDIKHKYCRSPAEAYEYAKIKLIK